MRSALPALAALVAASCSDVSSPSEFRARYHSLFCEKLGRCGLIGRSEVDGCRTGILAVNEDLKKHYDLDEAVRAKRMVFDATAAALCLEQFSSFACSDFANGTGKPWRCETALRGLLPEGGQCFHSDECVSRECSSVTPGCPGLCDAATYCQARCLLSQDEHCAWDVKGGESCVPREPEGGPCSRPADECRLDLVCIQDTSVLPQWRGTCQKVPGLGQPCSDTCVPGAYCDFTEGTGTCRPVLGEDSLCVTNLACKQGLRCIVPSGASVAEGRCRPIADVGEACDFASTPSICPSNQKCVGGKCTAASDGETCGDSLSCGMSFGKYCNSQTKRCEEKIAYGEKCDAAAGQQCLSTTCSATTGTCASQCK